MYSVPVFGLNPTFLRNGTSFSLHSSYLKKMIELYNVTELVWNWKSFVSTNFMVRRSML